jgi:NADH:ubiquinone oxidoreductase subunit F (NADH-binding)
MGTPLGVTSKPDRRRRVAILDERPEMIDHRGRRSGVDVGGVGSGPVGLPRLLRNGGDPSLATHLRTWGSPDIHAHALIAEVAAADLRGKGGAGFPAATKMSEAASGKRPIVVANGTEGEPASSKDKALLTSSPHLVIDGAVLAARAIGASEVVICVKRSAVSTTQAVRHALTERTAQSIDDVSVNVVLTPDGYLSGEESALVHWLNDGDSRPTFSTVRPSERGVDRRATLIQNVETLAHVALIARFGASWFRKLGTPTDPGTTLVTVRGHVGRPGVFEVPLGATLADVVASAGGTLDGASGVLLGGYFGTWVPAAHAASIDLSEGSLRRAGAALGCGVIAVIAGGACGLAEVAAVTRWMASQSAGQCGPCTNGLPAISGAVDALYRGEHSGVALKQLHRWLDLVDGRGACRHPDGTVRFVRSALGVFAADIEAHRHRGPCPEAPRYLPTPRPSAAGSSTATIANRRVLNRVGTRR